MFRRRYSPLPEIHAKRIALIKPSALGDIIHSLPVLEALRVRFPNAHISWIVNRSYESLLRGHPALDETIPIDRQVFKKGLGSAWRSLVQLVGTLRRARFDLTIDLQGLLRSGLIAAFTSSSRRVGLATAREGSRYFYTDIIPMPHGMVEHAVDRSWRVAEAFGVGELPKKFRLAIPDEAREWALAELRSCPRPWLAFGVGARWLTKRWPTASFAVLAKRAQKKFGGTVLFVGAADESPLAKEVSDKLEGPWRDYTGRTSLPQLASLLEQADMMAANDTGPLHLAAALGRPVVAPYTCTQVSRHGPYGVTRGAVESSVWCQGSYVRKCDRLECMTELHADRLWFFLNELLDTWSRNSRSA